VQDGKTLWKSTQITGADTPTITKMALKDVLDPLQTSAVPDQARTDFLREHAFAGVFPLMQTLRQRMVWVHKEMVRRAGRDFIKLNGVWPDETRELLAPADKPWPAGLPRQCKLYLDPKTLWPHRVEWWGPDPPRPGEVALMQMELRDPVVNRPLSAERCAQEFGLGN